MKERVITALILAPLLLALVIYAPAKVFQAVVALIVLRGAWEWAALMKLTQPLAKLAYVALVAAGIVAIYLGGWVNANNPVLWAAAAWWLVATVWVICYPAGLPDGRAVPLRAGIVGLLILLPLWVAASALQAQQPSGPYLLIYALVMIWGADIGAYAAGRLWGRHKLAPKVSPGKTWEGLFGGLVGGLVVAAGGILFFALPQSLLIIALVIVPLSVIGDLTESMFKRHSGIKDSGSIFPGHGGLLDRADSLAAAIPIFVLGMALNG